MTEHIDPEDRRRLAWKYLRKSDIEDADDYADLVYWQKLEREILRAAAKDSDAETEQIEARKTRVVADDDDTSKCAPDGQHRTRCNGTHNPAPGTTFVTARHWDLEE
jgi:hypothetical protein